MHCLSGAEISDVYSLEKAIEHFSKPLYAQCFKKPKKVSIDVKNPNVDCAKIHFFKLWKYS